MLNILVPAFVVLTLAGCSQRSSSELDSAVGARFAGDLIDEHFKTYGQPRLEQATDGQGKIVSARHQKFHTTVSCSRRIPLLVVHVLEKSKILEDNSERPRGFDEDESISLKTCRSHSDDFENSGFDRGHLAPAADFAGYSDDVIEESFLTSNIAPQVGPGFNRGLWLRLEEQVRKWASQRPKLVVLTGTIANDDLDFYQVEKEIFIARNSDDKPAGGKPLETLGKNKVVIPDYFFKIVFDPNDENAPKALAFLMENKDYRDKGDGATNVARKLVSIDRLEEMSGFNFFPAMPESAQANLEGKVGKMWKN